MTRIISIIAISVLASCAYNPPPIALAAAPAALETLEGEWTGEYFGGPLGRTGTITFTVLAGEDHAHGDVLMIPDGASGMYRRYPPYEPPPPAWAVEHLPQTIAIRLVRVDGRVVSGSTEQYWDPDRGCRAHAVFDGYLTENIIAGTFVTRCDSGFSSEAGQWKVRRDTRANAR